MKALGVTDHRFLGGFGTYRDSGMKWHEDGHAVAADDVHDNAFWHADLTEAADHLVEVIREVRPQVLVTYDQFGGYGHPDHIQAHRVAMYAAQLAAVPSYRRTSARPWDIAKIYWGAMSESRMRDGPAGAARRRRHHHLRGHGPRRPAAVLRRPPTRTSRAAVDAQEYVDQKMDALRAHATQITTDGPFFALSNNVGSVAWGIEFYRIVKGQPGPARARTASRPTCSPGSDEVRGGGRCSLLAGAATGLADGRPAPALVGPRCSRSPRPRPTLVALAPRLADPAAVRARLGGAGRLAGAPARPRATT